VPGLLPGGWYINSALIELSYGLAPELGIPTMLVGRNRSNASNRASPFGAGESRRLAQCGMVAWEAMNPEERPARPQL
jgi:hypothetical protein